MRHFSSVWVFLLFILFCFCFCYFSTFVIYISVVLCLFIVSSWWCITLFLFFKFPLICLLLFVTVSHILLFVFSWCWRLQPDVFNFFPISLAQYLEMSFDPHRQQLCTVWLLSWKNGTNGGFSITAVLEKNHKASQNQWRDMSVCVREKEIRGQQEREEWWSSFLSTSTPARYLIIWDPITPSNIYLEDEGWEREKKDILTKVKQTLKLTHFQWPKNLKDSVMVKCCSSKHTHTITWQLFVLGYETHSLSK